MAVGVVLAAVLLGFIAWDSTLRSRHLLQLSSSFGVTVGAPEQDARSATGYADGRRVLFIPGGSLDTAHWLMQTQAVLAGGDWRVRHVGYDNAPTGRDVHWALPYRVWLSSFAWIDHLLSGRPAGISVERAALVAGPVMLALLLAPLIPFIARRFSPSAAALVGIGTVAVFPFYVDFLPARSDHHGLTNICALLTVLFMVVGSHDRPQRWFIASAAAGALGLWISAATMVPVLIALGVAIIVSTWMGRRQTGVVAWQKDPLVFRWWGWVGGLGSIAAYIVEYFPADFGMRLEVNHPLYALSWIAAGEALAVLVRTAVEGRGNVSRKDQVRGLAAAGLVFVLPVTLALTHASTFAVTDPFLWQLHALHISEFQGLMRHFATGVSGQWFGIALPTLLLVPPLVLVAQRSTTTAAKAVLVLAWIPAAAAWLMGWAQVRWLGLAYAVSVPLIAAFFRELDAPGSKSRTRAKVVWTVVFILLLLPGMITAVSRTLQSSEFTHEEIRSLAERDVAHWLRLRAGAGGVTLASGPSPTTMLVWYGNVRGLGTLYWENAEGLKRAAALFATAQPEHAREMMQRLGITHIVFFSWSAFEVALTKLERGLPQEAALPPDSFIARLLASPVPPPWLRPIPVKLPDHPALAGTEVRIWEMTNDDSPAKAIAHAANYFLELGRVEDATRLIPALVRHENDLSAMVMLAAVASRQRDAAGFDAPLGRVLDLLGAAPGLTAGEHIHLVVVLTVAQRIEAAREQLEACMRKLNDPALRQLTPGTLADLIALSEALNVSFPSPELRTVAHTLLPPGKE